MKTFSNLKLGNEYYKKYIFFLLVDGDAGEDAETGGGELTEKEGEEKEQDQK